jgi:hypothetical protein
VIKNILRNKSYLQCCPITIYRDDPSVKGKESVKDGGDQQKELDVSQDVETFHAWSTHCTLYAPSTA